jgi:hypothetical protein
VSCAQRNGMTKKLEIEKTTAEFCPLKEQEARDSMEFSRIR